MNTLTISGACGAIESRFSPAPDETAPCVLICHPHPQHGGTMNNKVVTTIEKAMQMLGLTTLCFNYRGVGNSAGEYGHYTGEIADAKSVLAWLRAQRPNSQYWLAGFSFGAFIAASVANTDHNIAELLSIAPVLKHSDYLALTNIHANWHIVAGDSDDFVSTSELDVFLTEHPLAPSLHIVPTCEHFFHSQLITFREHLLHHYKK